MCVLEKNTMEQKSSQTQKKEQKKRKNKIISYDNYLQLQPIYNTITSMC